MEEKKMLNRIQAAKFLNVSTRTIDRYVAAEKFSVLRKNGKVLFDEDELQNFRSHKNPVVAQVVTSPAITSKINEEGKYEILYQEAKQDVEKRDELIRNMHYRLGTLEKEKETMVPLLEVKTERVEMEEVVEKISLENVQLSQQLQKAKYGRVFFFLLSFLFLGAMAMMWAVQNNIFDSVPQGAIIL